MGAADVEAFVERAREAGFTIHRGAVPEIEGAEVSHAAYGLADTGSVVLLSSDEPRSRSLLPFTHVTVLREDRILPDLASLFATLGDDLPSSVAVVTGPSRSADIEQQLTVGVHGPGDVHLVLLPSAGPGGGNRRQAGFVLTTLPDGLRAYQRPPFRSSA